MQHENLRSMAAIAEMESVHRSVAITSRNFKFIPKKSPPVKLPSHQCKTPSAAMTTDQLSFRLCNGMHACHALEIFIRHISANFEKSKTQLFSNIFFSNQ